MRTEQEQQDAFHVHPFGADMKMEVNQHGAFYYDEDDMAQFPGDQEAARRIFQRQQAKSASLLRRVLHRFAGGSNG